MKDEFTSKDFYLSAICIASKKIPLIRLEKSQGKFTTFIFDDPDNVAPSIIKSHWERTLVIPTRDVTDAINELKTRMYSEI